MNKLILLINTLDEMIACSLKISWLDVTRRVDHRPHLTKPVVTRRSSRSEIGIVYKVSIPCNVTKTVSGDFVCYSSVVEGGIRAPVIIESREMVDAQQWRVSELELES